MRLRYFILFLCLVCSTERIVSQTIETLAGQISVLSDGYAASSGYNQFNDNILPNQARTTTNTGGIVRANDLASKVNGRLRSWSSILQSIVDEINSLFGDPRSLSSTPTFITTSDNPIALNFSQDARFNNFNTSREDTILKIPDSEVSRFTQDPIEAELLLSLFATSSENLLSIITNNLASNPALYHQYFASEEGFLRYFPASEFPDGDYDPRLQSWYAEAVSGAKAVVILLDISQSSNEESTETFDAYIDSARAVINVLSSYDYLTVVAYAGEISIIDCEDIARELIRASDEGKQFFLDYLDEIQTGGMIDDGPDHRKGFEEAVARIQATQLNPNKPIDCSLAVVWLSNEGDFDNDLRLDIGGKNEDTINANIFLYSTRDVADETGNQFARRISCESGGIYERASLDDLAFAAARFYMLYANAHAPNSPKYRVGTGLRPDMHLGTVVTAVQPIYVPQGIGLFDLIGVAAIDFTLSDLSVVFDEVNTGLTFGMLLTDQSEAIVHPGLPVVNSLLFSDVSSDNETVSQEIKKYDIRNVETSPSFFAVRTQLATRETGTRPATALRLSFDGGLVGVLVDYDYTPVPDSPFSIVLSSAKADVVQHAYRPTETATSYYIRNELSSNPIGGVSLNDAAHGGQDVSYSSMTFSMASTLWFEPLDWLEKADDSTLVDDLEDFVNSRFAANNPGVRDTLKNHVEIVSPLRGFYNNINRPIMPGTVWSYVAFTDGTMSIFPGRFNVTDENYKRYDARRDAWYLRAIDSQSIPVAFSPPFVDDALRFGSDRVVVSSSKAVYYKHSTDTSVGPGVLVSVLGSDIAYDAFHSTVANDLGCGTSSADAVQCTLVNTRSEVVMHVDFLSGAPITSSSHDAGLFMGLKHPGVTQQLIDNGFLRLESVSDISTGLIRNLYIVQAGKLGSPATGNVTGCETGDYEFYPVSGTNVYLLRITNYNLDLPSCGSELFDLPAPLPLTFQTCDEARLDALLPLGPGECPAYVFNENFLDTQLRGGDTCEDLDEYKEVIWIGWDHPAGIAIAILTFFLLVASIIVWIFLIVMYRHVVIKAASPMFCYLIMAGIVLGYIAVFFFIGEPHISICIIRPILVTTAWVVVYANLLAKTWRIWRVFKNAKSMKRTAIKWWQLLICVGVGLLIQFVILIFWLGADTPEPEEIDNQFDDNEEFRTCKSEFHYLWVAVEIVYFGSLILFGAVLAFRVKDVATQYNEAKWIAFSIYNLLFVGVIAIPCVYALWEFPVVHFLIKTLAMLWVLTGTMVLLFGPKIFKIIRNVKDTRHGSTYGSSGGSSGGSSADSQNSTVKIDSGTVEDDDDDDSIEMNTVDDSDD